MQQGAKIKNHRLHALCPYFAMFPPSFARDVILETTKPGDVVLDPFSGRGTTLLEALLNDRAALACDINPVAAIVSSAKSDSPALEQIFDRIGILEKLFTSASRAVIEEQSDALPEFFKFAFHPETLLQILFLRRSLRNADRTDRFIIALCLGHLHGESNRSPNYFSNQMAHTIAMKPSYAVRYWQREKLEPPARNAFAILREKAAFRLAENPPDRRGFVEKADARKATKAFAGHRGSVSAVVTSPPYLDVTSFEEDQWLRLWFLGGKPKPTYGEVSGDDRHNSVARYFGFLSEVWCGIAPLLSKRAIITCRIAAKKIPPHELAVRLLETFLATWPKGGLLRPPAESSLANRQTDTFLRDTVGCVNEYDFTFRVA